MDLYLCGEFLNEFMTRLKNDPVLKNYFTVLFKDHDKLQRIISVIVSITNGNNMNDNLKGCIRDAHIGLSITETEFEHWLVILEECLIKLNVKPSTITNVINIFRNNHHLFIENEIITSIDENIRALEYTKRRASIDFT